MPRQRSLGFFLRLQNHAQVFWRELMDYLEIILLGSHQTSLEARCVSAEHDVLLNHKTVVSGRILPQTSEVARIGLIVQGPFLY